MARISIIGTGLIGGSIGLALKAAKLSGFELVGYDEAPVAAADARKRGAIDLAARSIREAVEDARMVIVATPPLMARPVLREMAPHLAEGAIVTDTLSTKAEISRWVEELLPDHVSYVGGHPMAGKETAGIEHADADLFRGKAYCVVPSASASESAVRSVLGMIDAIGAEALFIDAAEHDQFVAAISHLPLVVSSALFSLVRSSPAWDDIRLLASSGFRDITRLASGDPQMNHDICATNGDAIIHWIDRLIGELRNYRDQIADDPAELFRTFSAAQLQRDAFLAGADTLRREEASDMPSGTEQIGSLLFGGVLTSRYKEYEKRMGADQESRRNQES